MPAISTTAVDSQHERKAPTADDILSICAISIVAGILTNILHEGVGHGLVALLTGAKSGVLTTVAWSSVFDSRLVEAGGTLANLAAALVFWLALRSAKLASMPMRYFLLITCAFNLFTGTGYFFFSGVTNFGDWAAVISGLHSHWLWRALLVVVGASSYFAAVLVVGIGLVRQVGVPRDQQRRLRKLTNCCGNPLCPRPLAVRAGCSGCNTTFREERSRNGGRNNFAATTCGSVWRLFWRSSMLSFWDAE
jgi:hypothetical protein